MSKSGAGQQPQNVHYSGTQPPPLASDGGLSTPTEPVPMRNKDKLHGKHHVPDGGASAFSEGSAKYATMRGTMYLKEGALHASHFLYTLYCSLQYANLYFTDYV